MSDFAQAMAPEPIPTGAARRARERKQRALAKKVDWVMSLKQASLSHHTAPAQLCPLDSLRKEVKVLQDCLQDMQLQITNLAHLVAGSHDGDGIREQESNEEDQEFAPDDVKTCKEENHDEDLDDNQASLAATKKATAAIAQGVGSFLQTSAAGTVREHISAKPDISESDRQEVASLSGQQSQDDLILTEDAAVNDFEVLVAAKKNESKVTRVGELGVDFATMEHGAEDTAEAPAEDKKFDCANAVLQLSRSDVEEEIDEILAGPVPSDEAKQRLWLLLERERALEDAPSEEGRQAGGPSGPDCADRPHGLAEG